MRLIRSLFAALFVVGAFAVPAQAADLWRPKGQPAFVDANGNVLAGAKVCFFDAGTDATRTVFQDAAGTIPWSQPITLDSAGGLTDPIYIPTGSFKEKFLASDATDCSTGTVLFTSDSIPGAFDTTTLSVDFAKTTTPVISKAANYTVVADDLGKIINVDATAGNVTITLLSAATAGDGKQITVRKGDSSANPVTVATVGGQDVDGASSYTLAKQYETVTTVSDSSAWYSTQTVAPGTVSFAKIADTAYDTDTTLSADSNAKLPTQRAVKSYVDTQVATGIKWKDPVVAASTANVTLASQVENTDTLDGVVLATGNRILLKDQSAPAENGIYIVAASGAPTRATDMDAAAEFIGSTIFVSGGTANEGNQYTETATVATVDTDDVVFTLIASGTTYSADNTTLQLTGSQFAVKDGGIGATQIATGGVGADEIAAASVGTGELTSTVENKLRDVGEVIIMTGTTCPAQALPANAAAISRTTYSDYFAYVGTLYGTGDGSTTFNLPNYSGEFLRGWDNTAGNDPDAASRTNAGGGATGDNVGTKQTGQYASHSHADGSLFIDGHTHSDGSYATDSDSHNHSYSNAGGTNTVSRGTGSNFTYSNSSSGSTGSDSHSHGVTGTSGFSTDDVDGSTGNSGGNETRPRNVNVLFCIFVGA